MMKIDTTPAEHAIIAVMIQLAWAIPTGDWLGGAALGTAVFVGREHAQAEWRLAASGLGHGDFWDCIRAFNPKVWRLADVLDVAAPLIATLSVYAFSLEG